MRLPPYGLCERGDPGSSPAGPRETSPLVVISQPAPIAPHLSGPAEDSSSDSVSSEERWSGGREEWVRPSPSDPASRAERLRHMGLSCFLGGEETGPAPLQSHTMDITPKPNHLSTSSPYSAHPLFSHPSAPFKTLFLPHSYCSPLFSVLTWTALPLPVPMWYSPISEHYPKTQPISLVPRRLKMRSQS